MLPSQVTQATAGGVFFSQVTQHIADHLKNIFHISTIQTNFDYAVVKAAEQREVSR